MLKEFKDFVLRGNVVDLAVGIVVGVAFTALVQAFVADILTPIISIPGRASFQNWELHLGGATFLYGHFLNQAITFLIIAAAVFFFVVKPINVLMARRKTQPDVESTTKACPECLSSIPVGARRCAFCTSAQ